MKWTSSTFTKVLIVLSVGIQPMRAITQIEVQGHRGWRGAYPENTVLGFIQALELGVDVLEMDVVISGDGEVIVSHEPWINPEICQWSDASVFGKNRINIYHLTLDQIRQFDCGSKVINRFPAQQKVFSYKPTLQEVLDSVSYWAENHPNKPFSFNIEIKRRPEWDNQYCPPYRQFCNIVLKVIDTEGVRVRTVIQSFDMDVLEYIHNVAPDIPLAYLVEKGTIRQNLTKLSFQPSIYSPAYALIDPDQIRYAKQLGMRVIPWTVNKERDIHKMIEWQVDGIISDYPERVLRLLNH
jgi:glycerophosphoryl diester phosphodiesterase